MKRVLAISMALASALFGVEHSYVEKLEAFLILKKTFSVFGYYYQYDFDHDGYDYNDWVYKDRFTGKLYRLLAAPSTKDNVFGFAPVSHIDLPKKPTGYFIPIAMPGEDRRFSWLYMDAKSGQLYKLMGKDANGYMRYLSIDGDKTPDPLPLDKRFVSDTVTFSMPKGITDISCGWYHTCYVQNGLGYCFGDNAYGELGDGTTQGGPTIRQVKALPPITQIEASKEYTCALTTSQEVYCWGRNEYGKLGNAMVDKTQAPLSAVPQSFIPFEQQSYATLPQRVVRDPIGALEGIKKIAVGSWHACAIDDHYTYCWGQNFDGALGIGKDPKSFGSMGIFDIAQDSTNLQTFFWPKALRVHDSPSFITPLKNAIDIAAGSSDHTCIMTQNRTIRCWGWNSEWGELGINDTQTPYYTAPASEVRSQGGILLGDVKEIAAGADHTCALVGDSTVRCWGNNDKGQLGDGTTTSKPYPVAVKREDGSTLHNITKIFASRSNHTCAIDFLGTLYCWGSNERGELGIGSNLPSSLYARKITIGEPVVMGSAGGGGLSPFDQETMDNPHKGEHSCVLGVSGHIYCWGDNQYGQLGTGDFRNRDKPTQIK